MGTVQHDSPVLRASLTVPTPGWLAYDPSEARAHTIDGRPAPSVTQILKTARLSSDFSMVAADVLERKRAIGQAAHAATHYHDEGDLVVRSVDPQVEPYLEAWRLFRAERRFQPVLLETVVASKVHHYIGRFDRLGTVDDNQWVYVLLDMKTGDPDAGGAQWQLAAYEAALREMVPDLAPYTILRWSVQLRPDGTYNLEQYPKHGRTNRQDRHEFHAAACLVNVWSAQQRGQPSWR